MINNDSPVALFKLRQVFNIVRIGHVLAGDIIEGQVSPGNFIRVVVKDISTCYKIKSVDYVDQISTKQFEVGLVIETIDPYAYIKLNSVLGQTVSVSSVCSCY